MKIAVISASPHKNGTSALLADRFIAGAEEAGHSVFRFNAAFEDIHPCMACDACGMNGPCVQKDAIETKLMPRMLEADLLTLVTPLYYYGMSSQLKMVIDRFYSRTESLHRKKSLFMVTSWNSADWTMTAIAEYYKRRLCATWNGRTWAPCMPPDAATVKRRSARYFRNTPGP